MATAAGYGGSVTWAAGYGDADQNVYTWSLNYEAGEGETTDFSSSGPKTWIPLTTEWSGSFSARLDATTALVAVGTAATSLTLLVAGSVSYSGSAFATGMAITQDVNGVPEVVYTFRGTSTLTFNS